QFNKPQQKAGANTSIILGHFQKRLTGKSTNYSDYRLFLSNYTIIYSKFTFFPLVFQRDFFDIK
ncbi:hypothetical protein, partial [Ruminococcus sp. 1001275B_160808_F8]|uniref:hypothetical protein n=1 Tax=Ruminococcus sp. 1001275B_160808_F8 TaxID=2787131 RepID=UPI001A9B30C5